MIAGLSLGFANGWLLVGLFALPLLWLILRAVPPAPIKRRFPGVILLLGLDDEDTVSDRTPWWLLVLRMLALAALIIGLAGPLLAPKDRVAKDGPALIVLDGGWAAGDSWVLQQKILGGLLDDFTRDGREVAMLRLTTPETLQFQPAAAWKSRIPAFAPMPWQPRQKDLAAVISAIDGATFETLWMSDGLAYEGRAGLLNAFEKAGSVRVFETGVGVTALAAPEFADGAITLRVQRSQTQMARTETLLAHGKDPAGNDRVLASVDVAFAQGEATGEVGLALPAELRARITRFSVQRHSSAASTVLSGDALRRREVALITSRADREGLELLSPLHYLRQALQPSADVIEGALGDMLPANPDVIVLADVAVLTGAQEAALVEWVEEGGLLLRFAGPRLAASDISRRDEHPLMPVRLRVGGRSVGGALSWGEPKALAPFSEGSPFHGLVIPDDIRVRSQVVAQPDPTLADRVIAELSDGTPLVTRKRMGQGQVVLFHVTANAEWSGLPLSGLFVQMLERLAVLRAVDQLDVAAFEGTVWQPLQILDGLGRVQDGQALSGVAGEVLSAAEFGPDVMPGLYRSEGRYLAANVMDADRVLTPFAWPERVVVEGGQNARTLDLSGAFLALSLILLAVDVVASLMVSGRLWGTRVAPVLVALMCVPQVGDAQEELRALEAAQEVVLAHVITGNQRVDSMAEAGLRGLSDTLYFRTSVEPNPPVGVDLEVDELSFYPLIYWPVTPDQPQPSDVAYARLNGYLQSGGMILFDTRDSDVAGFGSGSPNGRKLQRLAARLDIPPLEVLPDDHVLTRTYYLLQDFPGRYDSRDVWVEAAPPDAEQVEGMPFRNLNDGVTPVVIGGNDWAAAWAIGTGGDPLYPVGRGYGGDRQRELAFRFGVNLVMHVLTGNYKSDQVHVPALLDRLGQ
jgi:hypothetical protein